MVENEPTTAQPWPVAHRLLTTDLTYESLKQNPQFLWKTSGILFLSLTLSCLFFHYFAAMIKQFLDDVCWSDRDFLVIDTPPGTSDEHITVVESIRQHENVAGAILVTTPQVGSCNCIF